MVFTKCISVFLLLIQFYGSVGKSLIDITDSNWQMVLEGDWMLEFMAPWCPACRQFSETWSKFADWGRDLDIKVGVVDVTENPELSGRFLVSALPTIYHIRNGDFRQYKGSRKQEDLIAFIDDKKWEEVDPVAWYLSPGSYQMGAVGFFFKLAMKMRALYTMMTDQYGIPEWGCYVIFAVGTILCGLTLGLVIVFLCDVVYPSSPSIPPSKFTNDKQKDKRAVSKDDDQDIIDDTEDDNKNNGDGDKEEEDKQTASSSKQDNQDDKKKSQPRKRNVRKDN